MKINRLYVKNFKNIKEVEIDSFSRINVIVGDNGQGKSSILSALSFVFTGSLEEKMDQYIRWGCDSFEIECNFSHECADYNYEIEVGKCTKRKLVINDAEEFTNSEAVKKLAEIIDPNLTLHSCVSEQGKTTQLLFQTPSARLKTIKEILKYDTIFDAVENIKSDIKVKANEIEKIDVEQNILEARTYTYLDEASLKKEVDSSDNIEEKLKLQEDIKILFEDNRKKKEQYDVKVKDYNIALNKKKDLDDKISDINIQINDIKVEDEKTFDLTELNSLISSKEEMQVAKVKYDSDLKNYNEAQSKLSEVSSQIDDLTTKISEIKIERLSACKYNNQSIEDAQSDINKLKIDLYKKQNELSLAKEGKCSKCGTDLSTKFDTVVLEKEVSEIESNISTKTSELSSIKKEIEDYNKKVNDQKEKSSLKKGLIDKIETLTNLKNDYESKVKPEEFDSEAYNKLVEKIQEQNKLKEEIEKNNKLVVEQRNKVNNLNSSLDIYKDELSKLQIEEPKKDFDDSLTFDYDEYESLKKKSILKDQKLAEYNKAVEFNEQLKNEEKENKKKIKDNDSLKENISKNISILKDTASILEKDFSSHCIDRSIGFIRDKMNDFFQKTYPKYKVSVKQEKNSVTFFYEDESIGIEAPCTMASGFEKSLLAVSCRVALCSLQDINLLILDEIDSDANEENSLAMFKALIDQDQFEQYFCITHCELTKEFFESHKDVNVFEILEGELAN
jgi:DNA repair exonuclease SbcCD ATPase subunit